jgi:hypothetical protein
VKGDRRTASPSHSSDAGKALARRKFSDHRQNQSKAGEDCHQNCGEAVYQEKADPDAREGVHHGSE